MKKIGFLTLILFLTSCVSSHMAKYVGEDIREVIIDSGNPVNAFDMPDGERAFQFYWGGGTYQSPHITSTVGLLTLSGNTAWTTATSITTGGYLVDNKGCLITYIAIWNEAKNGWIVKDTRYPKRTVC